MDETRFWSMIAKAWPTTAQAISYRQMAFAQELEDSGNLYRIQNWMRCSSLENCRSVLVINHHPPVLLWCSATITHLAAFCPTYNCSPRDTKTSCEFSLAHALVMKLMYELALCSRQGSIPVIAHRFPFLSLLHSVLSAPIYCNSTVKRLNVLHRVETSRNQGIAAQ